MKIRKDEFAKIINEAINKVIKEQIGTVDDLILFTENDYELYRNVEWIQNALLKKVIRGIVPDRNLLIDCSTMRKIQQLSINKYAKEVSPIYLGNTEKREFREYFADKILDDIEWEKENNQEVKDAIERRNKKKINEGTSFDDLLSKWETIKEYVSADDMLDCIFQWASSDQIEQWINWFEEEGWVEFDDEDED